MGPWGGCRHLEGMCGRPSSKSRGRCSLWGRSRIASPFAFAGRVPRCQHPERSDSRASSGAGCIPPEPQGLGLGQRDGRGFPETQMGRLDAGASEWDTSVLFRSIPLLRSIQAALWDRGAFIPPALETGHGRTELGPGDQNLPLQAPESGLPLSYFCLWRWVLQSPFSREGVEEEAEGGGAEKGEEVCGWKDRG